jgi:signal transduction histidine kinase
MGAYLAMTAWAILGSVTLQARHPNFDVSFGGDTASMLLWPLAWLLASAPQRTGRTVLAFFAMLAAALAAIVYISAASASPLNQLLAPLGLFFGVRGITSLKESNRVSQLHLEELNEAHARLQQAHGELQEAALQSMRYAALTERTRLAGEIHDGIGHHLTSLIVQLQALELMLPERPAQAAEQLPVLLDVARKAMGEVRAAVREWSDDESGLGLIALKGLVSQSAEHSGIPMRFECDEEGLPELPLETGTTLYRVLQEALTNVVKHSEARSALVRLETRGDRIVMTVSDDGGCTEETALRPDFGMRGMRSRCEAAGGSLVWTANEPHGLTVQADIPLRREENIE